MSDAPDFIPGIELAQSFFDEAVKPIIDRHWPHLRYAAALIGSGSEVLGFDTPMSTDHHWGPRLTLFLRPADWRQASDTIHETLRHQLPYTFRGYSTNFSAPNPDDNNTQLLQAIGRGPINHRIEIFTLADWLEAYLDIELAAVFQDALTPADWLCMPAQKLRTVIAGGLFHDDIGELTHLRDKLAYYPHDLWLYLMAAAWDRLGQEEAFVGRTGDLGDELGSRIIAARLIHDLMNLCFLMERQYPPYSKWFGTAFAQLSIAPRLTPLFHAALDATTWQERQKPLCAAYEIVGDLHNQLGITEPLKVEIQPYFGRPFLVIDEGRFERALLRQIRDPQVRQLTTRPLIGSIDLFSTNTELLANTDRTAAIRAFFQ